MKKKYIIKDSDDFSAIIRKKNGVVNNSYIINVTSNSLNISQFGITFVKNLCNAVMRNRLKRQTKEIIDHNKNMYEKNKSYIIIIRKGALGKNYFELEKDLTSLFYKIKEK